MNIKDAFIVFAHLPAFVAACYSIMLYKKLDVELKVFSYFLWLSALVQAGSLFLWFIKTNNMPLLHFYVAAGFMLICWFYNTVLSGYISAKIIWSLAILFLLFTLINSFFIQTIYTFNSIALVVQSVLIIILSLSTFILLLNSYVKETKVHVVKSLNWINSGFFIYYVSSLLIFYFGSVITSFPSYLVKNTWVLHSFFSIVMNCCFFMGLWKRPRN